MEWSSKSDLNGINCEEGAHEMELENKLMELIAKNVTHGMKAENESMKIIPKSATYRMELDQ
jgi:hypothetical protein